MKKILLAEDEEMLALIVKDTLSTKEFEVKIAKNGLIALSLYESFKPDLIVLDIMMPEMNGYEVAKTIRKGNQHIPIIFLSAKSQTTDVLQGFEAGANDYLKKPFSIDELIVRINLLLKYTMNTKQVQNNFTIGNYQFDFAMQTVIFGKSKITISYKEAQVLRYLSESINAVVEKDKILVDLWGESGIYTSRNLDVVVTKLRQYFKDDERIKFLNTRGIGYKLIVE